MDNGFFFCIAYPCILYVCSRIADKVFVRRMKVVTVCLVAGSILSVFWFLLIGNGYIAWSRRMHCSFHKPEK